MGLLESAQKEKFYCVGAGLVSMGSLGARGGWNRIAVIRNHSVAALVRSSYSGDNMPFFKKSTRREFLVAGSSAALAAATTAVSAQTDSPGECATEEPAPAHYSAKDLFEGAAQRTFSGEMATQVAMPLGGIGTGAICLNGNGGLQDYSIRERPETTALPEGFNANSPEAAFAVLRIKGSSSTAKLVEGPFPIFKIFDQGLQGGGMYRAGYEGLPRFQKCTFIGEFPFGEVTA
jgi:hypothetical protein